MSEDSLVIVTPVYEDQEASAQLFGELARQGFENLRVVAVDDGSVRRPLDIASIEQAGLHGCIIKLKRNVGHQRAIAIGLSYVADHLPSATNVVVMDSDGEDAPSTISNLLSDLTLETVDVVVAKRKNRVESKKFKIFYAVYKQLFALMTGKSISFGNFMAMRNFALHRLVAMQESSIHLAGAVLASQLRTSECPLDRGARYAGNSKMNFVGLALHGFKALMVFAEDVLVRVGIACALLASIAIFGAAVAVILKIIGFSTPGWFSVAVGILMLLVLQTGAIALMTLMMTGVIRRGSVSPPTSYLEYVAEIIEAKAGAERSY
ncbi:glycosyltransferase [Arenicellales bacterium IMCC58067]